MPSFTDQTNRIINLNSIPNRIISLVPSQTELLADLGLEKEVIGITKFCVHPEAWFRTKTRVGGTKQIKPKIIHELKPDLIIANKEENTKEQVEELARHYPVWISDVNNLTDAYDMITQIGAMTGTEQVAGELITLIQVAFSKWFVRTQTTAPWLVSTLTTASHEPRRLKTAYLIWRDPYMTAGGDTFIHAMLEVAGFGNLFRSTTRYPQITIDELARLECELLLLSSEPFPFSQKHIAELQPLLPNTKIMLVDGEMFSWYGSRLLQAPAYFQLLHSG